MKRGYTPGPPTRQTDGEIVWLQPAIGIAHAFRLFHGAPATAAICGACRTGAWDLRTAGRLRCYACAPERGEP